MNKNSGFSLIELLVTIAISSVVILMISFILVRGTTLFKGENEEIDIQSEMQIVRNQISETLMGAKSVVIVDAGEHLVIYTGPVVKESNKLKAEPQNPGDVTNVTTERIITYDRTNHSVYISSTLNDAISEGSLISNYVTSMTVDIDEGCMRETKDGEGKVTEQYYVNPLSINVELVLSHGGKSSDIDMNVRVRNILTEVAKYKISERITTLNNADEQKVYSVK